jgi:hypothetical protein
VRGGCSRVKSDDDATVAVSAPLRPNDDDDDAAR